MPSLPDTNTIVRYPVADEPSAHAKAKSFLDGARRGDVKAITLDSVVAECVYVLTETYQIPRGRAALSHAGLLRYKGIANSDRQELLLASGLFCEGRLDIVDCVLYVKTTPSANRQFAFEVEVEKTIRQYP